MKFTIKISLQNNSSSAKIIGRVLTPLFILCLVGGLIKVSAQISNIPLFEIRSDTSYLQLLDSAHWQILETVDKNLPFETISSPANQRRFHRFYSTVNSDNYWYRYRLKNKLSYGIEIGLSSGAPHGHFYVIDSLAQVQHFQTGKNMPWHKKDGLRQINAIPYKLGPQEEITIYYHRIQQLKELPPENLSYVNLNKLWTSDIIFFNTNVLVRSFFFGIMLVMALLVFLFYWNTKEKAYLYFGLVLTLLEMYDHPMLNASLYRFWPFLRPILNNIQNTWLIFFILFLRQFFNLAQQNNRIDKLLISLSIGMGISVIFIAISDYIWNPFLFSLAIVDAITILFVVAFITLVVITVFVSYKQQNQAASFLMIALIPLILVLSISIVAYTLGINPIIWQDDSSFHPYLSISTTWMAVVVFYMLFKNYAIQQKEIVENKLKQERLIKEEEIKRRELIEAQKTELEIQVAERTQALHQSLVELRATQAQLIQSEKLASLGELTAGIAHEIQNPLNFVNNFAEVSAEMLDEMQEELEKGDTTEAIAIATDLKTNLEKIKHHGQRASSIVKGMLEHSRASTGVKEPTDLNALADEYLRLAYHGLRAKDNNFNATMETHFDPDLPLVSVIPQDIGRVLLNLINNAFYAVHQRDVETLHATSLQNPPYQPTVSVSTQKIDNQILIKVKDNGHGIPEAIKEKIFQPFFTTKPTGQGTGLGLSLAYDIVTKGHGGTLDVQTKEDQGTEFTIGIPSHH